MEKENCRHKFNMIDTGVHTLLGDLQPAVFKCKKCKLKVTSTDVTSIEMLNHVSGWRSWIPLAALIVSLLSIGISVYFSFFLNNCPNFKGELCSTIKMETLL